MRRFASSCSFPTRQSTIVLRLADKPSAGTEKENMTRQHLYQSILVFIALTAMTLFMVLQSGMQHLVNDNVLLFERNTEVEGLVNTPRRSGYECVGGEETVLRKYLSAAPSPKEKPEMIEEGAEATGAKVELLLNKLIEDKALLSRDTAEILVKTGKQLEQFLLKNDSEQIRTTNSDSIDHDSQSAGQISETSRQTEERNNSNGLPTFQIESKMIDLLSDVSKKVTVRDMGAQIIRLNIYASRKVNLSSWRRFHNEINSESLYIKGSLAVDQLTHDMATLPLSDMYQHPGGSQLKLVFYYEGLKTAERVIWKPMRCSREQETQPDQYYFIDFDRHNAEIAAFHLDRALDFRRAPPATGRLISVADNIMKQAFKANLKSLTETFFVSPAGSNCFYGECDAYCSPRHAICGRPDLVEGALIAMLPRTDITPRELWEHPWKRSYWFDTAAPWEGNMSYCDGVRNTAPYNRGRALLDLMDMATFDFLTGNMDRHHYETFIQLGDDASPIHYDNGRGFGRSRHDEMSILAPIYQCCLFRQSTLETLLRYQRGPVKLSERVRELSRRDPLYPLVTDAHLYALDRRLNITLKTIHDCLENHPYEEVIIDDGF